MDKSFTTSLTFDDVLLRPGYTGFERSDITLNSYITKNIKLTCPIVSAPMDTVTEAPLAIALASLGGLGIIHRNLTIVDQAAEVKKVKDSGYMVGAAVGSSHGYEDRVKALVTAGVDVILIDSAHGYSIKVIDAVKYVKDSFSVDVIAGSVATAEGAEALINAGADGLRVGMGPGAICSTRIVSGMGVPQMTAIIDTAKIAHSYGIPIIADGGIKYSGDIVKAFAGGASTVMFGRLFAATEESPGETHDIPESSVPSRFHSILDGSKSYKFKKYRGMGSIGAMEQGKKISSEDEFHGKSFTGDVLIAEGVEGLVPCTGTVKQLVDQMTGGIISGMYYTGTMTIQDLWIKSEFIRITHASLTESHPHNIFITNPGDNYK